MGNADLKTKITDKQVEEFLNEIPNESVREDCLTLLNLMKKITGKEPDMWGESMVGFGNYHYKYESGREGDWFLTGFSPRKLNLTLYIMSGFSEFEKLLGKLGKHKTGKSCLYINKLDDVDLDVLEELIRKSVEHISKQYS